MEYRTLENTDSVCIYEAFTQAFSDYQVCMDEYPDAQQMRPGKR